MHKGVPTYLPRLVASEWTQPQSLSFEKWWNEPVFETDFGKPLSRKFFVLAMRNTDGGAHFDIDLSSEEYYRLSAGHLASYKDWGDRLELTHPLPLGHNGKSMNLRDGYSRVEGAHWATMRQIAWEFQLSIKQGIEGGILTL